MASIRPRSFRQRLASVAAGAAVGLVPLWWHVDVVDPGIRGIIAVFAEVAIYASDACLLVLAVVAVSRPASLDLPMRWLVFGLTLLAATVLLSALPSPNPLLAGGLTAHLALLTLGLVGVRSADVSRTVLVGALVASAATQSVLAAAQFLVQQPLVPGELHLPWLPSDASQSGTPVVLNAAGDRLLRGFGTFPHPNVLGGYLAMALVCLPLLGRRWPRHASIWWMLGALVSVGLLASFSRAAWLATIVGLGFWWWTSAQLQRGGLWLAVAIPVALAGIALSPVAPTFLARLAPLGTASNALERGSIHNRVVLDRDALSEMHRHLPLGVGGGNYGLVAVADGYQEGWGEPAPNVGLLITAELGLPGVVAVALVAFGMLGMLRGGGGAHAFVLAACLALVVLAMLDHYLWTMPLGRVIAWIPFALIAARRGQSPIRRSTSEKQLIPPAWLRQCRLLR